MGQLFSDSWADIADSLSGDSTQGAIIRQRAFEFKRLSELTFEQFAEYIIILNRKCKRLVDDDGRHVVFIAKRRASEGGSWKATTRIYCVKYNAVTRNAEACRCISWIKVMQIFDEFAPLMEEMAREEVGEEATEGTSQNQLLSHINVDGSMFLKQDEQYESQGTECVVCMERESEVVLPCGHSYCLPCIEQWNDNSHDCPTCRARLDSTNDAWVISGYPNKREFAEYLLKLAD